MYKFCLSVILGLGLGNQAFAQFVEQLDIPFTRYVLDNGLTLLVHEDHKAPIVAVNVWYHVGSKNEEPGKTGFAHLYEHLMYNGSENYNDEFFRPLDAAGASATASNSGCSRRIFGGDSIQGVGNGNSGLVALQRRCAGGPRTGRRECAAHHGADRSRRGGARARSW